MKEIRSLIAVSLLAFGCFTAAHAQDTREQAIGKMRKVEPKEMDSGYNKTAPLGQKLVDDELAKHPEVILMAIHAGAPKYDIVASNFGRIGKLGDEDDLRCIRTGKKNLEVDKTGTHYEVEFPLKDKAGKIIGAVGVVFNYKPGDDKKAMEAIADEIAKDMSARTRNAAALFGPA